MKVRNPLLLIPRSARPVVLGVLMVLTAMSGYLTQEPNLEMGPSAPLGIVSLQLAGDEQLRDRLGAAARESALAYSSDRMVARHAELYERLGRRTAARQSNSAAPRAG